MLDDDHRQDNLIVT